MSTTEPGAPATGATALTGGEPTADATSAVKAQAPGGGASPGPVAGDAAPAVQAITPAAELELKLPEGFRADDAVLGSFKTHAKEFGLKSEQAQKLFDLYAGAQAAQVKAQESAREAAREAQQKAWVDAAKTDKEYGGAEFEARAQVARKAMVKFATPELKAFLDESGLGDHPELIRVMYRVGKALGEDSISGTSSGEGNGALGPMTDEQLAAAMYPKMMAKKS